MKFSYKIFLVISIACIIIAFLPPKYNFGEKYIFIGLGFGAGLRSIHEFLKSEKQKSNKP
jgi:hypothetical protein